MATDTLELPTRPSRRGEPTWEALGQLPLQGEWTFSIYNSLEQKGRLVELVDGSLEEVPMPTWLHNRLALILCLMLERWRVDGNVGITALPPLNLRTTRNRYRHPDVMYLLPRHRDRFDNRVWGYADVVIEVVSEDDPDRDYITKRDEYAEAGVPECWIVDPVKRQIVVLTLREGVYVEHGTFAAGTIARSVLLPGFEADIGQLLAQAQA